MIGKCSQLRLETKDHHRASPRIGRPSPRIRRPSPMIRRPSATRLRHLLAPRMALEEDLFTLGQCCRRELSLI
jgi:hypothetical protein